jgi:hypothetical protein
MTQLAAPTRDGGAAQLEVGLGKLLKFEGRKSSASAGRQVSGDAQILIFTGVRYERGTPPPPNNHSHTGRKRKRV